MPTIEIGGARVAYAESGSGETVLLLHSSASSGAQWRSLTESLQETYRFLAPDLYGYGETDAWPGQGPLGLAEEAALADAVLADGDDPIHLVGHSYGGAVALRFALQHAVRLRSLTLIEPVAFHLLRGATADAGDRSLFGQVAEVAAVVSKATATGDYRGAMAHFVDYWNGDGAWSGTKPELRAALARRTPKVALDFWATMTEATPRAAYRQIAVPTLVLRGGESPAPTRRIAELIAGVLPKARLRTIAGAGHMLPLTHREAVNAAIAEHLFRTNADRQSPAAA
jgi:pimeloyl-ACP methyl ester carboxylesterase